MNLALNYNNYILVNDFPANIETSELCSRLTDANVEALNPDVRKI